MGVDWAGWRIRPPQVGQAYGCRRVIDQADLDDPEVGQPGAEGAADPGALATLPRRLELGAPGIVGRLSHGQRCLIPEQRSIHRAGERKGSASPREERGGQVVDRDERRACGQRHECADQHQSPLLLAMGLPVAPGRVGPLLPALRLHATPQQRPNLVGVGQLDEGAGRGAGDVGARGGGEHLGGPEDRDTLRRLKPCSFLLIASHSRGKLRAESRKLKRLVFSFLLSAFCFP